MPAPRMPRHPWRPLHPWWPLAAAAMLLMACVAGQEVCAEGEPAPIQFSGWRLIFQGIGGFGLVLENGKTVSGQTSLHARTAAGISQDGRYLLLLVIDGYQPDHSRGATVAETGAWLRRVDAWNGINLDGGGTSTMVIADAAGRPRLLSRPRQSGGVTAERVSGCHLGIRTARLRE